MVFSLFTHCLLPSDVLGRISSVNPKLSQLCKEKQRSWLGVLSGLGQVLNRGSVPPPAMVRWYRQGGEETVMGSAQLGPLYASPPKSAGFRSPSIKSCRLPVLSANKTEAHKEVH